MHWNNISLLFSGPLELKRGFGINDHGRMLGISKGESINIRGEFSGRLEF